MADDQLTLDLSQQNEYATPFVRNSEWLWVLDQNPSGTYSSGQSILETSSLSNSNKWLAWFTAYLAIPQRLRVQANTDNTGTCSTFMAGLKSGFFHSINSCQVEINGVTVQQNTQLSNLMWNYRLVTSLSYNDLIKNGSILGFWPDSSNSWGYSAAASISGVGFTNNQDATALTLATATPSNGSVGYNAGYLKRQQWICYSADAGSEHVAAATETALGQFFKSYVDYTAAAAGVKSSVIYNMISIVRLRDICPLFAQLGLCKGLLVRLTLTLNQPTVTYTTAAGPTLSAPTVSFPYGGQTNPIMITSAVAANGGVVGAAFVDTFTADLRIGTTAFSTATTANAGPFGQTNIRLWVQSVILPPDEEAELIANPIRTYKYNDIYEMDFAVAAGGSANQLLFNSVPRVRKLIMIPQDSTYGLTSPYDSSPATTLPMCGLTNFQVYLSGMPLFPTPVAYDYRQFVEQAGRTGLNYNLVEGLSSGLIGLDEWQNNYRYYVTDLHQGLESEDDVTKNIQVSFTSQSAQALRMYCFVEYERVLELNILSSSVVSFK